MESRNPVGYERQKLYSPINTASQRVSTYADMLANAGTNPTFFVVDNDEVTGKEDALYYWSGIEARYYDNAADIETKRQEVATNTVAVLEAKEFVEEALNSDITVDTYAQAVALFAGTVKRTIFVNQSSAYNDPGEYFIWFPVVQKAAHMGLDFDYLN